MTYAEFEKVALTWQKRGERGERLAAPPHELLKGYFALVDGVLYRYVG